MYFIKQAQFFLDLENEKPIRNSMFSIIANLITKTFQTSPIKLLVNEPQNVHKESLLFA